MVELNCANIMVKEIRKQMIPLIVSQRLTGRVGVINILGLSISEIKDYSGTYYKTDFIDLS